MNRSRKMTLMLLAMAGFSMAAQASDTAKLAEGCDSCHGENGISTDSDIPIIGGLSEFFIDDTLRIYQDKARPCVDEEYPAGPNKGKTSDMCTLAAELTEAQIAELAAHYSKLPFVPVDQPFDAAKAAAGAKVHDRNCEKCHAEGGSDPMDDAGLLAGQWTEYLKNSLDHFRAGERETDKKMLDKLESLSDEEIDALLNYYASLTDKYGK